MARRWAGSGAMFADRPAAPPMRTVNTKGIAEDAVVFAD
jgi:hypothetical protein